MEGKIMLNLESNEPLNLDVNEEVRGGEILIASDDILQDVFKGYLKPEELLNDNEDIQIVKRAINIIEEYVNLLDKHIEEI